MDLYEYIFKRKASRDYNLEPLSDEILNSIENKLDSIDLLFENAPLSYRFTDKTKGMFQVQAPHYLVISGTGKDGEQENLGFVVQQLILWFNSQNIGNCWLGASKDAKDHTKNDIVIIAFGKSNIPIYRELSDFNRKSISEISNVTDNKFVEAAHLAPSGMNLQPWYFEVLEDKIVLYRQILKGPISLAYKLTKVDIGIALAHFYTTYKHFNQEFKFNSEDINKTKKGYEYFGYIEYSE